MYVSAYVRVPTLYTFPDIPYLYVYTCTFVNCSVAYVSRSGGMSNELNNIISHTTNGVYEGVAIGGDRWASGHVIVM